MPGYAPACYGQGVAGRAFIVFGGKRILRLDYSELTPAEVIACMREAQHGIAAEPARSVRLLCMAPRHLTGKMIEALKDFAAENAPFVLATAVVGASPFQKAAILLTLTGRGWFSVEAFDIEEWAKDWLAGM